MPTVMRLTVLLAAAFLAGCVHGGRGGDCGVGGCCGEGGRACMADAQTQPAAGARAALVPGVPADAVEFQGHFYKVFDVAVSWHEARKRCQAMGGHLACIETEAEQKFITRLAKGRYLFLGATDEHKEDDWKWVNGAPWKFTVWHDGQPNNWGGDEHYLATYDGGEWVDVAVEGEDFWMPTGFLCEWPATGR